MKKIIVTAALLGCLCMMLMCGCGQKVAQTLEDLAASDPAIESSIEEKITTPAGTESGVSFSGDSFDITYTYKDQMDEDTVKLLKSSFDENTGGLIENCNSAIEDMQNQTGIRGITGSIIILNADGKEIWSLELPVQEGE